MKTKTTVTMLVVATLQLVGCETTEVTSKDGTTTKSSKLDANAGVLIGKGLDVLGSRTRSDGKSVAEPKR